MLLEFIAVTIWPALIMGIALMIKKTISKKPGETTLRDLALKKEIQKVRQQAEHNARFLDKLHKQYPGLVSLH